MKAYKEWGQAPEDKRPNGVPLACPWQVQDCTDEEVESLQEQGFICLSESNFELLMASFADVVIKNVPNAVTNQQLRQALILTSFQQSKPELHPTAIMTFLKSLPEPTSSLAINYFDYSNEMFRSNAMLAQLAPMLGLNSESLDDLFIMAGKLQ